MITDRFNVKIVTSLQEVVSFESGKIMCHGKEQTIQHPDGKKIKQFEGNALSQKWHEDRVRTALVRAILEQVATIPLRFKTGTFDTVLKDVSELQHLQDTVLTIRQACFTAASNSRYVKTELLKIKSVFDSRWDELKHRKLSDQEKALINYSTLFPEEKGIKLNIKKKTMNKIEKELSVSKNSKTLNKTLAKPNKQIKTIQAINTLIAEAGDDLVNLSSKTITARAHKLGMVVGWKMLFEKVNATKKELIQKGIVPTTTGRLPEEIRKMVKAANVSAGKTQVIDLKRALKQIKEDQPVNVATYIHDLQTGKVSDSDLIAIRETIIEKKDLSLLVNALAYLIANRIPRSQFVTLSLINAMPDCFTQADIDELANKYEDVELTEQTFNKFFSVSDATDMNTYAAVLQYVVRHLMYINPLSDLTNLNCITLKTIELLADQNPIIKKIVSVLKTA